MTRGVSVAKQSTSRHDGPAADPRWTQARGDAVLFHPAPTVTAPADGHWFVPDGTGCYCQACNLPRANRRHVERAD